MKKKIFGFNNGGQVGFMSAIALGEDGAFLASHLCSSEAFMRHDLGVTSDWKHEIYDKHFGPGNWEIEFVETPDIATHAGLQKALELNKSVGESPAAEKAGISLKFDDGTELKTEACL